MTAIARRYARAAVEASFERGGNDRVEALAIGLRGFAELLRGNRDLAELLTNPALRGEQGPVLDAVMTKLGLSPESAGLVRLLAERRRVRELDEVVLQIEGFADERLGRVRAYVDSPMALTDSQIHRIASALERRLGGKVVVSVQIDPELLGGIVCRVGDLTLDTSVRHELSLLKETLIRPMH